MVVISLFSEVEAKPIEDIKISLQISMKDTKESTASLPNDDIGLSPDDFDTSPRLPELPSEKQFSNASWNKPNPNNARATGSIERRKIISMDQLIWKPGKIFNRNLMYFDEDSLLKFNKNSEEGKDYFLVDSQTWKFFKKWYGCDMEAIYDQDSDSSNEDEDSEDEKSSDDDSELSSREESD